MANADSEAAYEAGKRRGPPSVALMIMLLLAAAFYCGVIVPTGLGILRAALG